MASIHLDPTVVQKLAQFKGRRVRLLLTRGLCATAMMFLVCLATIAFIDWYWLLSEQLRWTLSMSGMALVLFTAVMTIVRPLMRFPSNEEVAALIEKQEPELRENLLSAVELADAESTSLYDSPLFRQLLQGKVAGQMKSIRVSNLLPTRLVIHWMIAAFVLIAAAAFLLTTGDIRIRQLAARALMPGANIARVSRIKVEIVKPTPHSLMMAENETVAIVADVSGGKVNDAILEVRSESKGIVKHSMRRAKSNGEEKQKARFSFNLHLGNEKVEYRILAGDAITKRFLIDTRPRPRVDSYHKTYLYPEYTKLENKSTADDHGDIVALKGTQVELGLSLDQSVSKAELKIVPLDSEDPTTIPLEKKADKWTATIPVNDPAFYKIHLVSEETGFENTFSPRFEIQPVPDLVPSVRFAENQHLKLLLPPNDLLKINAVAEDDLPLVEVQQLVSINGEEWQAKTVQTELDLEKSMKVEFAFDWDLVGYQLKTGDQVTTKLVATDRKGNQGESVSMRVIIADQKFDPKRHTYRNRQLELVDEIAQYSVLVQQQTEAALTAVRGLRLAKQPAEVKQFRTSIVDYSLKQREQAADLLKKINRTLTQLPGGADTYSLDLTGRVVARIQHDYAAAPVEALNALDVIEDRQQKKQKLDELNWLVERVRDNAKSLDYHYRSFATYSFLSAIALDMSAIKKQQDQIVNSGDQSWERVMRQEAILIGQIQGVLDWVERHEARMPEHFAHHLIQLNNLLEQQLVEIQDASESEEEFASLKTVNRQFLQRLNSHNAMNIDGGLNSKLTGAKRDFDNRSGRQYEPIKHLQYALQRQQNGQKNTNSADATNPEHQKSIAEWQRDLKVQATQIDRHRQSLEQLTERRDLARSRRDGNAAFAADASLTIRVINSLVNQQEELLNGEQTNTDDSRKDFVESKIPAYVEEIAPAWRILEAGHAALHSRTLLTNLLAKERWNFQESESGIDHPRQWEAVNLDFEFASQRLRTTGIDSRLAGAIDAIRWSDNARNAGRKLNERRWKRDDLSSAAHELAEMKKQLDQFANDIKPIMDEARETIAKHLPSIPELARQVAKQVRELEQQTLETADKNQNENQSQAMDQLQQKQESVNRDLDNLLESLVEHANAQDLLDPEQREEARDADNSIAMIEPPAREMNREMNEAQQAEAAEKATELSEAAEAQEKTAKALDLVAEHFEKLDNDEDVSQTREQLREFEKPPADASNEQPTNPQNEKVDQNDIAEMAEQAKNDPKELMKQLEEELKKNPAMQKALSEIAKDALDDAKDSLEYAADDEKQIQSENENADSDFKLKKAELAKDLKELGKKANDLSRELVQHAKLHAENGKTPEASKELQNAQDNLNEAASKANAANENQLLKDLQERAKETQKAIQQANDALQKAKSATEKGKNENGIEDEKVRKTTQATLDNQRKNLLNNQKRAAQNEKRNADNQKRNADNKAKQADRQVKNAEQRVKRAEQNLKRQPDNAGLNNVLKQAKRQQETLEDRAKQAKAEQQQAAKNVEEKAKALDAINKKKLKPLQAPNPSTEVADEYTGDAQKVAQDLKKKADELAKNAEFDSELNPSESRLANSKKRQNEINRDVKATAEDLARAARHEKRLNNEQAQKALEEAAEKVDDVAKNEATDAENQLGNAAEQAKKNDQANNNQNGSPQNESKKGNPAAKAAQNAVAKAESSLRDQAKNLDDVIQQANQASQEGSEAQPQNGQPQDGQPQSGQPQDGQPQSGQPQNGQPQSGQPQSGQPQSGQPQSGDNNQAASPDGITPEQMERGRQLAQTLDELDRQLAQAASSSQANQGQNSPSQLSTLSQAAMAQQAAMARARSQNRKPVSQPMESGFSDEGDILDPSQQTDDFVVEKVDRKNSSEWGKLRGKTAEDVSSGSTQKVSAAYRAKVEAYFKALAERSKKN